VPVGEEAAQIEGGEHAPLEVDVAMQVGLGDARLVERAEGAPRPFRAEMEGEGGRRGCGAHAMPLAVGFREVEGGSGGTGDVRAKEADRIRNALRAGHRADVRRGATGCQDC